MALYGEKLRNAAEVHAFIKDIDDTIDRIREKVRKSDLKKKITEKKIFLFDIFFCFA